MSKIRRLFNNQYYVKKSELAFEEAMEAMYSQEYEEALRKLEASNRLSPGNHKIVYLCGLCAYHLGCEKSVEHFRSAVKLDEDNLNYQLWYGISNYEFGDLNKAKEIFLYIYANDFNHEKARIYYAKILNRLGEYDNLINFLLNGVGMSNLTNEELLELGYAYYSISLFEESIDVFKDCIDRQITFSTPYFMLSQSLCKVGQFEEATEILMKLKEVDPNEGDMVDEYVKTIKLLSSF